MFVDVHPQWALVYDWVTAADKKKAMRVLKYLMVNFSSGMGKSLKVSFLR